MNPKLAIAVGRNLETLDADAHDPGPVGLDEDRVGAGDYAQHFETQERHGFALRLQDHGDPPDNAVALGIDREQAAAAGRLFQDRRIAQQARKLDHEALRVFTQHCQPRRRKRLVQFPHHRGKPGFAQHHAGMPHRIREDLIIARQRPQLLSSYLVEIAKAVCCHVGVEPIGLREDDVEGDHDGAEFCEAGDHIRDPRPRPRPLAEFLQALFIDIDDADRPDRLHTGIDALVGIESPDPDFLDWSGIGNAQRGKADQERQASQPRIPDPPREPPS